MGIHEDHPDRVFYKVIFLEYRQYSRENQAPHLICDLHDGNIVGKDPLSFIGILPKLR